VVEYMQELDNMRESVGFLREVWVEVGKWVECLGDWGTVEK